VRLGDSNFLSIALPEKPPSPDQVRRSVGCAPMSPEPPGPALKDLFGAPKKALSAPT
jgi:hypothetical protein